MITIMIMITCNNETFFKQLEKESCNHLSAVDACHYIYSINTKQVMCTEYYMSPAACEIMQSTKHSMIIDDYRA